MELGFDIWIWIPLFWAMAPMRYLSKGDIGRYRVGFGGFGGIGLYLTEIAVLSGCGWEFVLGFGQGFPFFEPWLP